MKQLIILFSCLLVLAVYHGWQPTKGYAAEIFEEMSTNDMLYVRGLVSSVSVEKMQVAVRPPKDKRIVITVTQETIMDGFKKIDDLKKKQQVKVWYAPGDGGNRAVKIKKMMDLGC